MIPLFDPTEPTPFVCRNCGGTVVRWNRDGPVAEPPASGLCAPCEWLAEFAPDELELRTRAVRRLLDDADGS